MSRFILVHGCEWTEPTIDGELETIRRINAGLSARGFPALVASDLTVVHIAHLMAPVRLPQRRLPNPVKEVGLQIYNFLTSASLRTRAAESVANVIGSDTRVVIAHSLGTVAAYEALCLLPSHNVAAFITLGSPLAIPRFIRGRLDAFSTLGRYAWPRAVSHWVNFYDRRDVLAMRPLRRYFGDGDRVDDRRIRLPSRNPHRLAAYLSTGEVICTVGAAAMVAFSPISAKR